jgi:polyphosphate kinase
MTYSGFQSAIPKPLLDRKRIFDRIKSEDMLLHHPYDSFDAFLEWLDLSARDPQVQSIEITIYRMGVNSPIAEALKTAASLGKKVRVLIELRARFDELNNLKLSEEFRSHGIEVGHGFSKLKLHAKLALVTRQEGERLVHYTHLSTGNYHAQTAKQYTDFGILTANAEIGEDAALFFRKCLKGEMPSSFKKLLNAPSRLHKKLLQHIEEEMNFSRSGGKGRIVVKVNAMVDEEVTEKLYEASQAGVSVDLIVRGACSVVPGVQGLSENIRVFSIVDRFLEHSRIYYFGSTRTLYLSSADWMPRNFFSRLELAFPVLDPDIYRYIEEFVLPIYLSDYAKAWELTPLGVWKRRPPSSTRPFLTAGLQSLLRGKRSRIDQRSQILFEEIVKRDYQGTPLA